MSAYAEEPRNVQEVVRILVLEEASPEEFAQLSLKQKRQLQALVTLRYLLRQGHAHGTQAIGPAVKICKETAVGVEVFMGPKLARMLASKLAGTGPKAFTADAGGDLLPKNWTVFSAKILG